MNQSLLRIIAAVMVMITMVSAGGLTCFASAADAQLAKVAVNEEGDPEGDGDVVTLPSIPVENILRFLKYLGVLARAFSVIFTQEFRDGFRKMSNEKGFMYALEHIFNLVSVKIVMD